jgi:hypothetical protein
MGLWLEKQDGSTVGNYFCGDCAEEVKENMPIVLEIVLRIECEWKRPHPNVIQGLTYLIVPLANIIIDYYQNEKSIWEIKGINSQTMAILLHQLWRCKTVTLVSPNLDVEESISPIEFWFSFRKQCSKEYWKKRDWFEMPDFEPPNRRNDLQAKVKNLEEKLARKRRKLDEFEESESEIENRQFKEWIDLF